MIYRAYLSYHIPRVAVASVRLVHTNLFRENRDVYYLAEAMDCSRGRWDLELIESPR